MVEYSDEDKAILNAHVTNIDDNIYVILNLPPEVIAVLFAYVSRSPASFRDNLLKLIKGKELDAGRLISGFAGGDFAHAQEKAKDFHERWVVGYGHNSVAEHAVASVAIEDVSILASKVIEDNRLAAYTEKSTRYQVYDKNKYYKPDVLKNTCYEETCNHLFDVYCELIPKMIEFMEKKYPKPEKMGDVRYEGITKARACDCVRYLLPASTLTNLAMTTNGRAYEYAVSKLLSSPLKEVQVIGKKMKNEIQKIIPTLVKYAEANNYFIETNKHMEHFIPTIVDWKNPWPSRKVILVEYDKDAYDKIASAMIYRFSNLPFAQVREKVKLMTLSDKEEIIDSYLSRMGPHDWPMRELEHVYYTFDILCDYGAFRDIQRHRICTQTNQDVTCEHGYDVPSAVIEAGYEDKFVECMDRAKMAYDELKKEFPKESQYVVPLAFKKRVLFTWNLRTLFHFIRLRSGKEGHISYREVAWECYDAITKVHPVLGKYLQVSKDICPSRG